MVAQILSASDPVTWGIFKWDNELQIVRKGDSDFETMKSHLSDEAALYVYMRIPLGADRRNKFVFVKWLGENVRPVQRARSFDYGKKVSAIIKVFHLEIVATRRGDLIEKSLLDRLTQAAGANYDQEQNAAPSEKASNNEFGSYKRTSKQFFQQMEQNGNLKKVVYETKPMARTTPVDLGNRSMTVGASSAKANTVELQTKRASEQATTA